MKKTMKIDERDWLSAAEFFIATMQALEESNKLPKLVVMDDSTAKNLIIAMVHLGFEEKFQQWGIAFSKVWTWVDSKCNPNKIVFIIAV